MTDESYGRSRYHYFKRISARWIDNDVYGHINNATYYTFFDTVANGFLIERGGLDFQQAPVVAFIVASSCQYRSPISYPTDIDAGFCVNRLGRSSVEYGIGVFAADSEEVAAFGTFTHVFVDRVSNRSVAIPQPLRSALESALVSGPST